MIFKSIFNKSLKHFDEEVLTSYIVKTIVLWRFEDTNLDYNDWQNDTRIWEITGILFEDLYETFDKGFLKDYFIPEINVLKRLDENLRDKCRKRIIKIRENLKTVVLVTDEVTEARYFMDKMMSLLQDVALFIKLERLRSSIQSSL